MPTPLFSYCVDYKHQHIKDSVELYKASEPHTHCRFFLLHPQSCTLTSKHTHNTHTDTHTHHTHATHTDTHTHVYIYIEEEEKKKRTDTGVGLAG